jgi:hypothetical protein
MNLVLIFGKMKQIEHYWKNYASLNPFDNLEDFFEEVMLLFVVLIHELNVHVEVLLASYLLIDNQIEKSVTKTNV